jgi:hypothetical protein
MYYSGSVIIEIIGICGFQSVTQLLAINDKVCLLVFL